MTAAALRLRIASVAGVFFMLLLVLLLRGLQLSLFEGASLRELARQQHGKRVPMPSERGPIVDRDGQVLAATVESASIFLRPKQFEGDESSIQQIADRIGVPVSVVAERASSPAPFVWVLRDATPEQAAAVEALGMSGVGSEPSRRRRYPHGTLAGQVIGVAGTDSNGLEGLELQYDHVLREPAESLRVQRDARGRWLLLDEASRAPRRQPARVELTIDARLQEVAERELEAAVKARRAAAGAAVVMDPFTGEILALANSPSFDPNRVAESTAEQRRNRVVTDRYEPGSTFKGILAAAAIEAKVIRPDERVYCENGGYMVGKRVVRDHHPYGWLSFVDVIRQSSNIGSAKVGERLGSLRFYQAIREFGLGEPTGIDLPGEVGSFLSPAEKWQRINLVTISFGQGIAVTPLQLVRAYAAIANGGKLMRPYLVRRVVAVDGTVLHENQPQVTGQPISPETAATVTQLLRGVVETGTGKQARVEGISVAGKTGTAQKVDTQTRQYSRHDYIASFIGFLPAEAPRFVILVLLDSPRTATYGGVVAAPVFRQIAEVAVDRLGLRIAAVPAERDGVADKHSALPAQLVSWDPSHGLHGMPSFIGLSLREALVLAARTGWEVDTIGSGYVIEQDPPPGAATGSGRRLALRFGSAAG